MRPFGFALVATGLSVVVAVAAGCEEPIPAHPTYDVEVKPLFEAHCVRCHGAGGTLNRDPETGPSYATDMPNSAHLNFYADQGDCAVDPVTGGVGASCERGAKGEAATIKLYVHLKVALRMPLAPSEPLTDWELGVIDNWVDNGAPEAPP